MSFAGESVTRVRAPEVPDRYSGPDATSRNWDAATSVAIGGWLVAGASSEGREVGRNPITSDFTIYNKTSVDVVATDRLVIRGTTCEVVGRPFDWHWMGSGVTAGIEIKARVVEG